MSKASGADFRTIRRRLPDEVFLLPEGQTRRPLPRDIIKKKIWRGIMHLPDDVAITTSGHQGAELATLYELWGDWLTATGLEEQDALFNPMVDAADCFQSSTFDSLHGYYRSALSNLRTVLELIAIGVLGSLAPTDSEYRRWVSGGASLVFPTTLRRLRRATKDRASTNLFKQDGWLEQFYYRLCDFTHSRPGSSDGDMWQSNGPIYVRAIFAEVFRFQISTYAASYVFAKIARPRFEMPKRSKFLFETPQLLWSPEIALSFELLQRA